MVRNNNPVKYQASEGSWLLSAAMDRLFRGASAVGLERKPLVDKLRSALVTMACAGLPACAQPVPASSADSHQPRGAVEAAPTRVRVSRTIVTPTDATSSAELFQRGHELYELGDFPASIDAFDRVATLDPDGPLAARARFRAAVASEDAGAHGDAAKRFQNLVARYPDAKFAKGALVRAIRLYVYKENWTAGSGLAEVLLTRYGNELGPRELIVGHSARALALVAKDDDRQAEAHIAQGRRVIDQYRLDAAGAVPRDLAQLYFALGEMRRIRGSRIKFDDPGSFADLFEERAQLLLDAQAAYSDAMRAHDAHWSAMAGFRVGELYGDLHAAVVRMPRPPGADTERRRKLFDAALRLRYLILLSKGINMFEHTLSMAERTGEASHWVERTRRSKRDLERRKAREEQVIDSLPFTRADLGKALEEIASRNRADSRLRSE